MVRPAQRRQAVAWTREAYRLSERWACRAIGAPRSTVRYRSVRPHQEAVRKRLKELASVRVRAGYKQLHVFLRREGWPVNHELIYRLYTEEGLTLKRRRPRRHRSAVVRKVRPMRAQPNQQWAMDFIHDTLASGEKIRLLTAIDLCTRECAALQVAKGFSGADVASLTSRAGEVPGRWTLRAGSKQTCRLAHLVDQDSGEPQPDASSQGGTRWGRPVAKTASLRSLGASRWRTDRPPPGAKARRCPRR
jgi:hypothetical protein